MEFIDWLWIKSGVVVFAAFLYGLFGGLTEPEAKERRGSEDE